jgi:NADPH:quinone reductase-like Zn-dependent oxidoreductase
MKAIFFEQHGDIEALKYADLPTPEPKPGEALVRVRAVALNHLDIWVRRGWQGLSLEMPHIGGSDISGEIVSVNADSVWSPGTKVVINPGVVSSEDEWTRRGEDSLSPAYRIIGEQLRGGMAEYVTVPIKNVFRMPEGLSFEEAAAPLLVATTIWRMLFKRANLRAGETALVVGTGGGVNSLTIPFAKAAGATVYALAGGPKKVELARKLGAQEVIDYKKDTRWPSELLKLTRGRGVDVVVDNVGTPTIENSIRAAARGGRIVTVGNTAGFDVRFDNRLLFTKQISIIGSTMGSTQDFLDALQFMLVHGIKAPIDRVEPLSEGIKMLQYLEEGKQSGKIVLRP